MTKKRRSRNLRPIDKDFGPTHTKTMLQLSGNNEIRGTLEPVVAMGNLMDLKQGETGILECLELPADDARRLMELGFLPGMQITAGYSAPGGDPRVFQVDGSEFALRSDTARLLKLRAAKSPAQKSTAPKSVAPKSTVKRKP
jgi:ferrous iron transport protein A